MRKLWGWRQVKRITTADGAIGDLFGNSVDISSNTVVVGATHDDDAGSAYVFERDSGGFNNWGQVGKLVADDAAGDDKFGTSVAIHKNAIVVGASGNDDAGSLSGSAYVFGRDSGGFNNWGQVGKLVADDAAGSDIFGSSVAIYANTFVVGAMGDDSTYVFNIINNTIVTLTSPNTTNTYTAPDSETLEWTVNGADPCQGIVLSMKRDSVPASEIDPDNLNWYRFTEHDPNIVFTPDGIDATKCRAQVSIPGGLNADPPHDWRFFARHVASDKYGASDETFVYEIPSIDTVKPVINLIGSPLITLSVGDTYTEQKATATDNVDGEISSDQISIDNSSVNTGVAGTYTVTYNVSDAAGNPADEIVRTVIVEQDVPIDTVKPEITLIGSSLITLSVGDTYTEQKATATDNVDGDISSDQISIDNSSVNTGVAGTYMVTYNVNDAAGNPADEVVRTIIVVNAPIVESIAIDATSDNREFPSNELFVDFTCVTKSNGSTIAGYEWDFGDDSGISTSSNTVSHLYGDPSANYTVSCKAIDAHGNEGIKSEKLKLPVDNDGDALPDVWELHGYRHQDVHLPLNNATTIRENIYLWIDHMYRDIDCTALEKALSSFFPADECQILDFEPSKNAIDRVVSAFAQYGISLHVESGGPLHRVPYVKDLPIDGDCTLGDSIAISCGLTFFKKTHYYRINNELTNDREHIFHYMLIGNRYDGGSTSSGLARPKRNSIFVAGDAFNSSSVTKLSGTIMHEFGHALKLGHGGPIDGDYSEETTLGIIPNYHINLKPNYLSVMNYNFQFSGLLKASNIGRLDYSRVKLSTINESNLTIPTVLEIIKPCIGIGCDDFDVTSYGTYYYYDCIFVRCREKVSDLLNITWEKIDDCDLNLSSCNSEINWDGTNQDENNSAIYRGLGKRMLISEIDWDNLGYDYAGKIGNLAGREDNKPQYQEFYELDKNIVEPPAESITFPTKFRLKLKRLIAQNHINPGQTLALYSFKLKNDGTEPDSYVIEYESEHDWIINGPISVDLQPSEEVFFAVTISAPLSSTLGTEDALSVSVTSQADNYMVGHTKVTTVIVDQTYEDNDNDGLPDSREEELGLDPQSLDSDNDGLNDGIDPDPLTPNETVLGNDPDNDGISSDIDNCAIVANPGQVDTDNDGIGDACDTMDDTDSDNDSVPNITDNCPTDPNPNQEDTDGDGIGDACDPLDNTDLIAPVITLDGSSSINLFIDDTYLEPGATATDDVDGDISDQIVIDATAVNTTVAGTYSVTYNVNDASGNAAVEIVRTVIVDTDPVIPNVAPVANNDEVGPVQIGEIISFSVTGNDLDNDDNLDPTNVLITSDPGEGVATVNPDGTIKYAHTGSTATTDTLSYTIQDTQGATSNVATVSITVTNPTIPNVAPVATNDEASVQASEAVIIPVLANDNDSDGELDNNSLTIVNDATYGQVDINYTSGEIIYTHDGSASSTDTFSYTVQDNDGAVSNEVTVTINITSTTASCGMSLELDGSNDWVNIPNLSLAGDFTIEGWVNLAPGIDNKDAMFGQEGSGLDINFYQGKPRLYAFGDRVIANTSLLPDTWNHIAITRSGTQLKLYINGIEDATGNWNGTLSLKAIGRGNRGYFKGMLDEIRVWDIARSDTEIDDSFNTHVTPDALGLIGYWSFDDSDQTVIDSSSSANDGSLGINTGIGTDDPLYQDSTTPFSDDCDGGNTGGTTNETPVANSDTASVQRGSTASINVLANDVDSDGHLEPSTLSIVSIPNDGIATINNAETIAYTNNANSTVTSDTLSYTVNDNEGAVSNVATVTITITDQEPQNKAPVANNDTVSVQRGSTAIISVLGNDNDSDGNLEPSTVFITSEPNEGVATFNDDNSIATTDTLSYTVKDNGGETSNTATVTITITDQEPQNEAPIADIDIASVQTGEAVMIDVLANDNDSDGTLINNSLTIVNAPTYGSVDIDFDKGQITYTHNGSDSSSDTFTYTVEDDDGAVSNEVTVTIITNTPVSCGMAIELDGSNDWVNIPNLTLTSNFTIEGWVKLAPGIDNKDALFGQEGSGPDINFYQGKPRLYAFGDRVIAKTALLADTWNHIAITRSGTQLKLYINGIQDATGSWNGTLSLKAIGRGNRGYFKGMLDEIRVWNVARSAAEIIANFDIGVTPDSLGPIAYWSFNDSDQTVIDSSNSANDGSLGINTTVGTDDPLYQSSTAPFIEDCNGEGTDGDSNAAPVSNNDTASVQKGSTASINVLANDDDGDGTLINNSLTIVNAPTYGSVNIDFESGQITYTHDGSDSSSDTFTYTVEDDDGAVSNEVTVTINITNTPVSCGMAIELDGSNDWVNIPNLTLTSNFTIEGWVKLAPGIDNKDALFGQEGSGPDINFYQGKPRLYAFGDRVIAKTALLADTWNHIAITRSGTQLKLYINGIQDATGSWNGTLSLKAIGRGNRGYFKGMLNEIRVWNVARSGAEIIANFDIGVTPDSLGLIAYWSFNDSDQTVIDSSNSANDGSLGINTTVGTDDPLYQSSTAPFIEDCSEN